MENKSNHTFHIPVMGLSYTIDSPIKIAHLGISSVMSILEHNMIEKMREHYSKLFNIPFEPITSKIDDFRAKRITSYLNLVDVIVKEKVNKLRNSFEEKKEELEKYFELLPSFSNLRERFNELVENNTSIQEIQKWISENLHVGDIDVNIMTKLDGPNYIGNEQLPVEQNNAHAALRGFANSTLQSSLVLSAGMNPRLFSYMENFDDFYPDSEGKLKKRIIIKVSDYRSALIQGKFFAKKGLWVSEYRVESGLNCGGHAFATDGYLLGPILEEFKKNREDLLTTTYEIFKDALSKKGKFTPKEIPSTKLTAQGGVGTADEHQFLLDKFNLDSVGWGTPFLLVPEASSVDEYTMQILSDAKEEDLYLSDASPLGVPFNNVRGSSKDIERKNLATAGKPGSSCPKRFLAFNADYSEKPICTASTKYINIKIEELKLQNLNTVEFNQKYEKITEKECLCNGLANSVLLANSIDTKMEGEAVSICPGPNMAYYSGKFSLKEMADHIYGRLNLLNTNNRPNMFIKELKMYIDYLNSKIDEASFPFTEKQVKYFETFKTNLNDGIEYYKKMFAENKETLKDSYEKIISDLEELELKLQQFLFETETA
ncbi:MAG: hypothetical protein KKF62_17890 [Bacteroidetes bacterium]|nr:hypothetical protein [Bacteroidota bacterium]MBU1116649.1 hypothetical protein [Bacteroidota bacterium]MBU1797500.1 hypothetical protein [Bacteroidota bacterium]